ncbi:angiogenic factor with G patch and FHA domains 1-like isoform X2 [Photinus pyralis]|nr:angiogenic factor with G patch and FHA domains 1-like isoform X2 [Photinus pyralis]
MDSSSDHIDCECSLLKNSSDESDFQCSIGKKFLLSKSLQMDLKERYPNVLELIKTLRKYIEQQQKKISKLKVKLCKKVETRNVAIQTNLDQDHQNAEKSVSEEITEAAEMAMQSTGFVYEETSGLYYDYNSGYYYNAELGLYYDGNSGTYMTYNTETETYEYHSQVPIATKKWDEVVNKPIRSKRKKKTKKKVITSCDLDDLTLSFNHMNIYPLRKLALDISNAWPPCIRIVVKSTDVAKLTAGTLYIITYQGGTLGREGDHAVLIPDISISKHHLKFTFDNDLNTYTVTDLGSRNGTLLNGKRMSACKQESEPVPLKHGNEIQIGSTVLLCHIHSSNETCNQCEPGLLQSKTDEKEKIVSSSKSEQHKSELRKLRKKFAVNWSESNNCNLASGYTDRAQVRRDTIGSHNEHEKTQVASIDE